MVVNERKKVVCHQSDDEGDKLTKHHSRAKLALPLCWIELGINTCKDVATSSKNGNPGRNL